MPAARRASAMLKGAAVHHVAAVLLCVAGASAVAGCARTVGRDVVDETPTVLRTPELRSATNLPAEFAVVRPARIPGDCPHQLRDTGLRATLTLVHSIMLPTRDTTRAGAYSAFGSYAIEPPGVYGDEAGEALRVDCRRLRALGLVRLTGG